MLHTNLCNVEHFWERCLRDRFQIIGAGQALATSRWEHIVYLPHDPLSPLDGSSDHSLSPRTCSVIKQILSGLQVPSD